MSLSFRDPRGGRLRPAVTLPVIAALLASGGAGAPGIAQTIPKLTVSGQAQGSSNPFLLPGGNTGAAALGLSIEPGITITDRDSVIALAGVLTERQYSRRYGNFVLGNVSGQGTYRDSERLSASGTVSFSRDVSIDVVTDSIDALADPRSIRNTLGGRVAMQWHPDQYTDIEPVLSSQRNSYTDSRLLSDTRSLLAELSARKRTGPTTKVGVRGAANWISQAGQPDNSILAVYVTVNKQLGESWRLTAEGGAERAGVRQTELADTIWRTPARIRPSVVAELCRDGERVIGCLTGSLASQVSGLAGLQRRLSAAATFTSRLSQRIRLVTVAEYQRASIKAAALPPLESLAGRASLAWDCNQTLTLVGVVEYRRREDWTFGVTDAGFVGLELRFSPRLRS